MNFRSHASSMDMKRKSDQPNTIIIIWLAPINICIMNQSEQHIKECFKLYLSTLS
jgi:hypothetical protein